jgi:uncharacterized coiled-coil DUF342 family protein
MSEQHERLKEMIDGLKRQRDELALQIHLGKAEAKEEWDKVTAKLDELLVDYEPVKDALSETTDNVVSAMKLVSEEVWEGFKRIKKSL